MIKYLLAFLLLTSTAYAQGTAPVRLIFLNECPDLDPSEVFRSDMTLAEYEALTVQYDCLNRTQASQRQETFEQVWRASYNVKLKKPVTIISIDPKLSVPYDPNLSFYDQKGDYTFGAWKIGRNKFTFANMPGCANARKVLEKLLRRYGFASK